MLVYSLSFSFPVSFVAHYVLQVFVALDIFASHYFRCVGDYLLRYSRLPCNFYGERRARLSYCQLEQCPHLVSVVEHGTVNHSLVAVGEMLEVLVVGGDYAVSLFLAELFEYAFGYGSADIWFGTASKLVY